jgi:hypothetical protein
MRIPRSLWLVLALVLLAADGAGAQPIWRGRSGGFDVVWSGRDVSATRVRGGVRLFSLRALGDRQWADMLKDSEVDEDGEDTAPREVSISYRVLSVVGPIVSVEEFWYCDCRGAHPISHSRFIAYDVSRGTPAEPRPAVITDWVDERELVRALAADRILRQAMDAAGVTDAPATLAALMEAVHGEPVSTGADECTYAVGEDFASSFAFHHVEGDRVAVRFSLSHHVEICRGHIIQVGVLVPVSDRLRSHLAAARARTAGFLMADLRRVAAADAFAKLQYEPPAQRRQP